LVSARRQPFNPRDILAWSGLGRSNVEVKKNQVIFSQGEPGEAVFFIQRGKVKLCVVSPSGKEATIGILCEGEFLGEEIVAASHPLRMATAVALTPAKLMKIDKKQMVRMLHEEHAFSEVFVAFLLARNFRIQGDLVDQLFNSSEKRLARTLLLLAQIGKEGALDAVIPKISQETLAEMIGTTRSRVNLFMNRFRKLGFVEYNGKIHVHASLLNVVLHD
jgi:CRP-like cAMP-binding protein